MPHNTIQTGSLSIGYLEPQKKVLHKDLSLCLSQGSFTALLGPNGCGKSTLMRSLSGSLSLLGGNVTIMDKPLHDYTPQLMARTIAFVSTERFSLDKTRVKDVVAMGRYPYTDFMGRLKNSDYEIIEESLTLVGMSAFAERFFNNLSDGEKQRVLIAKALAQQTPIVFLDEPTAHLDLPNRIKIMIMLRQMAYEKQKAILLSTHELDLALQMADTIWLMGKEKFICGEPKQLVESGAFSEVFSDPNFTFVSKNGQLQIELKING